MNMTTIKRLVQLHFIVKMEETNELFIGAGLCDVSCFGESNCCKMTSKTQQAKFLGMPAQCNEADLVAPRALERLSA